MRHLSLLLLIGTAFFSVACTQNAKKGAASMETLEDSVAYLFGAENAKGLKDLGYELNPDAFYDGYLASSQEADLILSEEDISALRMQFQMDVQLKQMEAQRKTNVTDGQPAPDLSMATPEGSTMSISDLRGKYVLVDFWASWCKPCRVENPNVVKLYNQYKDRGFEIIGVSLDDNRDAWLQAIDQDGLKWKHMSDLKKWGSESVSAYGFQGIPYTVLLDPQGNIIAQHLRSVELAEKLSEIFGG